MILTIGRQLGAGGLEVGRMVAERTGMKFFDKELIEQAAHQWGLSSSCFEGADERKRLGFGLFGIGAMDGDELFRMQSETIKRLADENAEKGAIFIGRCANYVLRERNDVRSVFLTASSKDRIRRVVERFRCNEQDAQEMMHRINKQRETYYDYYASKTWGKASTYHLCINTSEFGIEDTVKMIIQTLKK